MLMNDYITKIMRNTRRYTYFIIGLIILSSIIYLIVRGKFYIDKDSYQFLASISTINNRLGKEGALFYPTFYNRVGYTLFISFIKLFSKSNSVIIYLNFIFHALSTFFIYLIIKKITGNTYSCLLGSLLFLFNSFNIFISNVILSDTLGLSLLLIALYLLLKKQKFSNIVFLLFCLISTLRFEYLILLIPIYFLIDKNKKIIFCVISSLLLNIIFLTPYLNKEWITIQINILSTLKNELIFFILAGIIIFALFHFFTKQLIKTLLLLTILISIILLLNNNFILFLNLIVNYLVEIILIVFFLIVNLLLKKKINNINLNFFLICFLLLFVMYKTFYFQHLIILTAFITILLAIFSIPSFEILLKTTSLNKTYRLVFLTLAYLLIISINLLTYLLLFYKYDTDLAQKIATINSNYLENLKIKKEVTLSYSNFPEANYVLEDISSKELLLLDLNTDSLKYILISSLKNISHPVFNKYVYLSTFSKRITLNYTQYNEQTGFNVDQVYLYLYIKN